MLQPKRRVEPKQIEQRVQQSLENLREAMVEHTQVEDEIERFERLVNLEHKALWLSLRSINGEIRSMAQQKEDQVLLYEDFSSYSKTDIHSTAWVDTETKQLRLYPAQMAYVDVQDLALSISSNHVQRQEHGDLASIVVGGGLYLEVLHPKDAPLLLQLKGVIAKPCNHIRFTFDTVGELQGRLTIGEHVIDASGDVLDWTLPISQEGVFVINLQKPMPEYIQGADAVSIIQMHALQAFQESAMPQGMYQSRAIELSPGINHLELDVQEHRYRDTDILYRMAAFESPVSTRWERACPGEPYTVSLPTPHSQMFHAGMEGFGDLDLDHASVFQIGHLEKPPTLDTLHVFGGVCQWKIEAAGYSAEDNTPENFEQTDHELIQYAVLDDHFERIIKEEEWLRFTTYIRLPKQKFDIWSAPGTSGELSIYVNNVAQAINPKPKDLIRVSLQEGLNKIEILVRNRTDVKRIDTLIWAEGYAYRARNGHWVPESLSDVYYRLREDPPEIRTRIPEQHYTVDWKEGVITIEPSYLNSITEAFGDVEIITGYEYILRDVLRFNMHLPERYLIAEPIALSRLPLNRFLHEIHPEDVSIYSLDSDGRILQNTDPGQLGNAYMVYYNSERQTAQKRYVSVRANLVTETDVSPAVRNLKVYGRHEFALTPPWPQLPLAPAAPDNLQIHVEIVDQTHFRLECQWDSVVNASEYSFRWVRRGSTDYQEEIVEGTSFTTPIIDPQSYRPYPSEDVYPGDLPPLGSIWDVSVAAINAMGRQGPYATEEQSV